ncbi:sulfate transporter, putative [Ixodes scapularis]|uniref:Sulfate transporter, putative n=1 Tax=Ixodes scapularis TaxID=6945 RepID=B7QDJ3_IXOSC|nr:sulfate transporter, putative [Ixodes scapularis]|eukprot:XP_002413607.1 sulfate transporter, putative [Ixodes scapularis]
MVKRRAVTSSFLKEVASTPALPRTTAAQRAKRTLRQIPGILLRLLPCITWVANYDVKRQLVPDVLAGLSTAVLHVPQGMFPVTALMTANAVKKFGVESNATVGNESYPDFGDSPAGVAITVTMMSGLIQCILGVVIIVALVPMLLKVKNLPKLWKTSRSDACILGVVIIVALVPMLLKVKNLPKLWKTSRSDAALWLLSCVSVIFLDVTYGLIVGSLLGLLIIFLKLNSVQSQPDLASRIGVGRMAPTIQDALALVKKELSDLETKHRLDILV